MAEEERKAPVKPEEKPVQRQGDPYSEWVRENQKEATWAAERIVKGDARDFG